MTKINVVVGRKKNIFVSTNATAGIISTNRNEVTLKNVPTFGGGTGGFTNGQSIEVNNFVLTGSFSANSSNGNPYYFLKTNGNTVYWSYGYDFITGDYGEVSNDTPLGEQVLNYSYDCALDGPLFIIDLE